MKTKQIIEMSADDLQEAISSTLEGIVRESAFARFEGRQVSTQTACEIFNINKRTLYRYIGAGLIHTLDREGEEDYKFDLRELLETNVLKHKRISTWKRQKSLQTP